MDPVFRLLVGRWGLGEQGVAVLTAALGFGVLTAWYLAGLAVDPAARGRRGPFEYFTATVGDLVLRPSPERGSPFAMRGRSWGACCGWSLRPGDTRDGFSRSSNAPTTLRWGWRSCWSW